MKNESKKARHTFTVYEGFKRHNQELNNPSCWVYESIREAWGAYHDLMKGIYKRYDVEFCCGGRIRKDLVLVIGLTINYEEYDEDADEWVVIESASDSLREYDYTDYTLDKELED